MTLFWNTWNTISICMSFMLAFQYNLIKYVTCSKLLKKKKSVTPNVCLGTSKQFYERFCLNDTIKYQYNFRSTFPLSDNEKKSLNTSSRARQWFFFKRILLRLMTVLLLSITKLWSSLSYFNRLYKSLCP